MGETSDGFEQQHLPASLPIPTELLTLQQTLVTESRRLFNLGSDISGKLEDGDLYIRFENQSHDMVTLVSDMASKLTINSLGDLSEEQQKQINAIFIEACERASRRYAGIKPGEDTTEANKYAGTAAKELLPSLLDALGIDQKHASIINRVQFPQIIQLTAKQLGIPAQKTYAEATVKDSLKGFIKDDKQQKKIDVLPFDPHQPLTREEEITLNVAMRLANATWMVTQLHRAVLENDAQDRIDPQERNMVFNPYDLLKIYQYNTFSQKPHSPEDGLFRVAYELWKDIDNINKM